MKNSLIALFGALLFTQAVYAQLSERISPQSFNAEYELTEDVPVMAMPAIDVETLMAEDEINNATKLGPYRFGEMIETDIEFHNSGIWETLPNGDRIWRLNVLADGAYSLNFMFDDFYMPTGATLHIYNQNGENLMGAFTSKNNHPSREFATFLIAGDNATIEYYEPSAVEGLGSLGISTVVHGYRDVLTDWNNRGGGSGACNNNVACPEGAPWVNEINSVTRIVLGGGLCSGALIVDVPESGTPYYLTANHCISGAGSGSNWVFNFNYQASSCGGTSAPNNQSLTGCVVRANNSGSDFALLELNNDPPANYDPFFAGWDRSGTSPTNQVCIHHPSGDIKKISFDDDPATNSNFGGAQCWRIANWEDGTTEGGSSGSPLFDQNHRIIGQLYGGQASCQNNINDYYGRFGVSWNGSSSSNRLKDWLDPNNTGVNTMDGYDPFAPSLALDAAAQTLSGLPDEGEQVCNSNGSWFNAPIVTVRNSGVNDLTSLTVDWTMNGVPQTGNSWNGTLTTNQSTNISMGQQSFSDGAFELKFWISSANGGADLNADNDTLTRSFEVYEEPTASTSSTNENLWTGGGNGTATVSVSGGTSPYTYAWSQPGSGNTSTITGLGTGNYSVTVTDANGCQVTETVSVGNNVGINDLELANSISIYPNPTSGIVSVEFPSEADIINITITDVVGREINRLNVVGMERLMLDMGSYTEGVYHLNFLAADKKATKRVIHLKR